MSSRDALGLRESASAGDAKAGPSDLVWRFFSSVRLALILILAIAGLCLLSILIVQAPAGVSYGSSDYQSWLEQVRPRYGALTEVFSALSFFTVTTSLWLRALLGLLAVNTLVCTLNRWPRIWRDVFRPPVRIGDAVFAQAVRDPGAPIIWVARALLVLGMTAVLYFPHRRCWVRLCPGDGAYASLSIAGVGGRDPGPDSEFARIVAEMDRALEAKAGDRVVTVVSAGDRSEATAAEEREGGP